MNRLFTCLLFALTFNLHAQSGFFEGRISLKLQYFDSLGTEIDPATIKRDSEMHYYVAGGNYKSLNENGVITQLYNSVTNKYFFNNQGQVQVMDASVKFPQNGVVSELPGEFEVLGKSCKKLLIESKNDSTVYYYSHDISVDKKYYQKHNFGNWNLFLNSTGGGLALRYEISYPALGFEVVMEAFEIENMELSEEDFDINSYLQK